MSSKRTVRIDRFFWQQIFWAKRMMGRGTVFNQHGVALLSKLDELLDKAERASHTPFPEGDA